VTIFDVRDEGEPYLVMEYVEGQSLQQLVSRESRTLPLSTKLRLIQEVAEALHYAHAQGVVHRDIKPANILVNAEGHPKIADFGIAKLNQADLTLPGQVLGSPAFMAPEQLSDESVDARSDLFSLGVILFYMLTGHRPFQGNSMTTVCFKLINHEPPPVSAFESKFPPELDKIVSRAIAKDPAQRYQSGMAMASDIQGLRERSGFVHGNVDWVPRNVRGGAESRSTGSGNAIEGNKVTQRRGASLSKILLFSVILTIVTGCLVFWNIQRAEPKLSGPITTEPAVEIKTAFAVDESAATHTGSKKEQTAVKTPLTRSKASISQAKLSRPPAKVSLLRANVPVAVSSAATLRIEIDHHFIDARASVWLDNNLVYADSLHGDPKRRGLIFRRVEIHQFEAVRVAAGKHDVRVRIQSAADSYDQSETMADAMIGSNESVLRIICGKKPGQLQLILQ
jgi:serine/threonine protein kinase